MSEPKAVPTFVSAEEDGDTMTLTYRTEAGEVGHSPCRVELPRQICQAVF